MKTNRLPAPEGRIAPLTEGRWPYVRWWYLALRREGCSHRQAYETARTFARSYGW